MSIVIIRAIPRLSNYFQGEQYYNIGELTWQQQSDFRVELENQNMYVQDVHLADTMAVQIGAELRRRNEAEAEAKKP